ncbi:hypothetical protein Pan181_50140 [Aeoliella mucimassa]|uniref:Uncharacterized protein n=2 Tax=Aeoliella mucimassa TaxID=2527972 RepID=A0A518AVM5_9BACT|nr:hypothetical protein Pan181_50140 [Aeoliella mucimassa]
MTLLLASVLLAAPAVHAQYETKPIDEAAKRYGGSRAKRYARNPTGVEADRTGFGNYIRGVYLASMTQFDAESLADLGKLRYDYMRNYLWAAAPSVQQDLTRLTFTEMSQVIRDNYHPAVKYNAMLLIGELDATYATQTTGSVPMPEANKLLTDYVNGGVDTARAPAPLIVGALVGLERHAKSLEALPAANRGPTAAALLKVLEKDSFPQDLSPSVSQWIKVIAARGLANIGVLGDGNRVHNAMFKMIGDEKARLNTRVRVAELLDMYKNAYGSATGLNEQETVQTLLQLATDIASDEEERAIKYEDEMLGGMGGMRMGSGRGGGFGFGGGGEIELPDEYQRRRLVLRLTGLKKGVEAVKPAIKDQRFAGLLDEVLTAIEPVLNRATEENLILLNLVTDVKQMSSTIATASASLGVEAVDAPPESEEEAAELLQEEEAAEAAEPAN